MNIRPLPYYNTNISELERDLASSLRMEFVPKVRRRLAGHHLRGFRHGDIVRMVKRCKQQHPWFVLTQLLALQRRQLSVLEGMC